MKKRFKYLALREAKNTGAFGHYLTMPVTDKTRTLIIGERLGDLKSKILESVYSMRVYHSKTFARLSELPRPHTVATSWDSTSRPVRRFAVLQSCTRLRQTSSLARAL